MPGTAPSEGADAWRKWAGAAAEALQPLQVELLVGAIEACREGHRRLFHLLLGPVEVGAPIDLCPFWLSSWLNYAGPKSALPCRFFSLSLTSSIALLNQHLHAISLSLSLS